MSGRGATPSHHGIGPSRHPGAGLTRAHWQAAFSKGRSESARPRHPFRPPLYIRPAQPYTSRDRAKGSHLGIYLRLRQAVASTTDEATQMGGCSLKTGSGRCFSASAAKLSQAQPRAAGNRAMGRIQARPLPSRSESLPRPPPSHCEPPRTPGRGSRGPGARWRGGGGGAGGRRRRRWRGRRRSRRRAWRAAPARRRPGWPAPPARRAPAAMYD
jgi:hypothetical protein